MPSRLHAWFDARRDSAPLVLRLVVAAILIEGTQDNVFSWERMIEFQKFLAARGYPWPVLGAIVSAYAQFICGFLILFGALTRVAGAVMVVNFIHAIVIAHLDSGWGPARLPLLMLAAAVFFLIYGPGRPSIDRKIG